MTEIPKAKEAYRDDTTAMTETFAPAAVKPTRRMGSDITARESPPQWWVMAQLTAVALHIPLALLTGSQSAIASRTSTFIVGTSVVLGAISLYILLTRTLMEAWKGLALVSVVVVMFWHWNGGAGFGPFTGPVAAIAAYVVIAAAAFKYADRHFFKLLAFVVSVALAGSLAVLVVTDYITAPDRTAGIQNPVELSPLHSRRDVILIVLDGYGRSDAIRRFYGYDNEPFLEGLRAQGFQVADRSVANYSITHLSIPALLNMSYMHPEGASTGNNDLHYLATQISGNNRVTSYFLANGYTYIHGESDHWFNVCGQNVDICLPAPDPDITGFAMLARTPIGSLIYRTEGDPSTALNLQRIAELTNWNSTSESWPNEPRFVFLHLQLPHPPLFLDSECKVRIDSKLSGRSLFDEEMSREELALHKAAWVEQVECANSTLDRFLMQVAPDTIIAIVSDHGPDSTFVLESSPTDFDPEGLEERFPNLTAVRLPRDCSGALPQDISTVNVFRVIISCMTGESIPLLETRNYAAGFTVPILDVTPDTSIQWDR